MRGIIPSVNEKPEPFKWRITIRNIASVGLALTTGIFPVSVANRLNRHLSLGVLLLIYGASVVMFSCAWRVYFDRPEELDKEIPISSHELRRRKKEFYDWLNTQGRH